MEKVNSINFKATPLNTVKIKKYNKINKKFMTQTVTFVQLDANNRFDLEAVETAAKKWKNAPFMKEIATASHWMKNVPIEVYAVTAQKNNFEKLQYKNILGFAEMRQDEKDSKFRELCHLQVNPSAININSKAAKKSYKGVGSSILTSLKKYYDYISLISVDNINIENFYLKNNFIRDYTQQNRFLWSHDFIEMLKIHFNNLRVWSGI